MKAEKCMEMLLHIVAAMSTEEKESFDYYTKVFGTEQDTNFRSNSFNKTVPTAIGEMMRVIKLEVAKETDKANGKTTQAKVIKSVLKNGSSARPATQKSHIINGKQYVCDGYRIFEFNDICESVPIAVEGDKRLEDGLINVIDDSLVNQQEELEIPDRTKLAFYIKTTKAKWKANGKKSKDCYVLYNFGKGLPMVNAEYLLDALDGITNGRLYCTNQIRYNGKRIGIESSALIMLGDNGRMALLPVRKAANDLDSTTEI